LAGNVAVNHSRGSAAENGSAPVSISYKVTPKRVQVAAGINRPIHGAGLFGRHVSEGPAMISGGAGACDSRGSRDAIPNPVSQTLSASSTSNVRRLMSL